MSGWLRLRQICLAAAELQPVVADLEAVLGLAVGHVDPGVAIFGLENSLLPVGGQFLEVVAPVQDDTAVHRHLARRKGDGGYMVITQCDDPVARRRRVEGLGVRIAFQIDRPDFVSVQLHPRDTGGAFLEIDWQRDGEEPDGPWWPAGADWRPACRTEVVRAIVGAELQSPDPGRLAHRWSEITEIPLSEDGDGHATIGLENATLRFVEARDGRGEGLGGVDLAAVDRERAIRAATERALPIVGDDCVQIGGTRFYLR